MKLWSGRFEKQSDGIADDFNTSLPFDKKLMPYDIEASIAHCKMLAACGIIADSDADKICETLLLIKQDILSGTLIIENAEDIHMFVEAELIKRIGDIGKKLHTARSRNDQVATDFRMYLRDSVIKITQKLSGLITVLTDIANRHTDTALPGYTHLQKAQPVTLAHHYTAYCEMFLRDSERFFDCYKRINVLPLGSCALAGTTYPIDRKMTAALLGFKQVCNNSMDGVSDRDFAAEFLFCCALTSMHLSRLCEELILWSSGEFSFIEFDDAYSTGSSIMPQKKNPDMAELIRGKTGRVYGNLIALLTTLKSLPLAYNKDMQEDKQAAFDSEETVLNCLNIMQAMLPSVRINKAEMKRAAKGGFSNATDVADYLVKKGMPFRQAHEITGRIVLYCIKNNTVIEKLSTEQFKSFSDKFESNILNAVKLENVIGGRNSLGGTAKSEVKRQLKDVTARMRKLYKNNGLII
ncbi:MAG: argininosuccinate lyase [Clostridia bacterium]|nr:argininosuccinate lyase [Clostridia bacterium]